MAPEDRSVFVPAYDTGSDAWLRSRSALAAAEELEPPAPGSWPVTGPAALPVAAPDLHVPRRTANHSAAVSPLRALAGALVAVAGVLLGIGALLWATDGSASTAPVLAAQPAAVDARVAAPAPAGPIPALVPTVPTAAAAKPVAAAAPVRRVVLPARLPLTVLNNSTRSRLADAAAARFRNGGWPVTVTGNFRGRLVATTIYYAPGQYASAQLLQRSFSGLTRVLPRFARLPGRGLTVVLTRSYLG